MSSIGFSSIQNGQQVWVSGWELPRVSLKDGTQGRRASAAGTTAGAIHEGKLGNGLVTEARASRMVGSRAGSLLGAVGLKLYMLTWPVDGKSSDENDAFD